MSPESKLNNQFDIREAQLEDVETILSFIKRVPDALVDEDITVEKIQSWIEKAQSLVAINPIGELAF